MANLHTDSNVKQGQSGGGGGGGGGMDGILNIIDQANMICSIHDNNRRVGDNDHSQDRWPVSSPAQTGAAAAAAATEEGQQLNNNNDNDNVNFDIEFSERFRSSLNFNSATSDFDDEEDREGVPPPPPPPPAPLQLSSSYASHDSSSSSFLASSSFTGTGAGSYAFQTPPTVTRTTVNKNLILTTPPPLQLPPPFHQHSQVQIQNDSNIKATIKPGGGDGSCYYNNNNNNKSNFMNDTTNESGCRSMDEEDNSNVASEDQKNEEEDSKSTSTGESNRTQSRPMVWPSFLHSSASGRKRTRNVPSNTTGTGTGASANGSDPEMITMKSKFPILSSAAARRGAPPVVPLLPGTPEFEFGKKRTLTVASAVTEAVKVGGGLQQQQQQKEDGDVVMAQRPVGAPPTLGVETEPKRYNPFMNHLPIHSPIGGYSVTKPSNVEFFKKFQQHQHHHQRDQHQQDGSSYYNNNSSKVATASSSSTMQISFKSDSTPSPSDRALKRALLLSHTRRLSSYSSSMAIPILEDEEEVDGQAAGSQPQASTITLLPHSTSLMSGPPSPSLPLPPPPPPMNLHVDVASQNMAPSSSSSSLLTMKATTSLMPRTSSYGTSMDALSPPAPLSRLRRRDGMEQRSGFYPGGIGNSNTLL